MLSLFFFFMLGGLKRGIGHCKSTHIVLRETLLAEQVSEFYLDFSAALLGEV